MNKPGIYEVKNKEGKVLYSCHTRNFGLMIQEAINNGTNLSGADLRGQDLSGLDLKGGRFEGADFDGALLNGVQFQGAKLKNANMTNCEINSAGFYGTDLENVKFSGSKMQSNWFTFCHVKNTDFTDIKSHDPLQRATLQDLELAGAKIDKDLSRGRPPLNPEAYQKEAYESYKKAALKVHQELVAKRKQSAANKFNVASIAGNKTR